MHEKVGLLVSQVATVSSSLGFDIVKPFDIARYNVGLPPEQHVCAFDGASRLAIVIANTRELWPVFVDYYHRNPSVLEYANPFDEFVESRIERVVGEVCGGDPSSPGSVLEAQPMVRYAHRPDPNHISFAKVVTASGLAYAGENRLCIHPEFGPWFSFRAILVFDVPYGEVEVLGEVSNPCHGCRIECRSAYQLAIKAKPFDWRNWLAVRDACKVGREFRFSDQQIFYHYTKALKYLRSN